MGIDRSLNLNPEPAGRAPSKRTYRAHRVRARSGTTTVIRLPLDPNRGRIYAPCDNVSARQRPLVGDSLNDEQGSDGLFSPLSH